MKIVCNRQELTQALSNVQRAVSTKSTIPALEGILLKAEEKTTNISGYDLEIGMTTDIPALCEKRGSVVLNARLFSDIVRRLPEEQVYLTVDEKNITTITSGHSEFFIPGIPADEYPDFPVVNDTVSFVLPHEVFKSMIRQTIFAVADSDNNPIHTGVLFEMKDGIIKLVAVDGFRLAIRTESLDTAEEMKFVVPGKTLSEVMKLLKDDDTQVTVKVGRRHVLFAIGDYVVMSRLLEGDFLDYKAAIPKMDTMQVKVQTRVFVDSVERVSLLISDRRRIPLRCIFENNEVKIFCETEIGRANDQFTAEISGEGMEIGFNNRYLLDALRNAEDDEIVLCLNGPISPLKIVPREGDSFLFLVLPVRL